MRHSVEKCRESEFGMEATTSDRVVVKCRKCGSEYEMRKKDLAKTSRQNGGYVPCWFCGDKGTTWEL